jgi:ubiquinone/menaquinone biosynthesis C-methylase UbiE
VTEIVNTDEYEAWNGDSGHRWVADADRRDRVLAPVADALLAAADLATGEGVADIGCGCGATALAAARAVGPTGAVYGIDLSEPMLDVARRRAEASGLSNITLVHGDVQTHRFPARSDVAISRFGTMFFADHVAALTNIRHGLRPASRLCLATWQPLAANDWLTIPGTALLRYGDLPEAETSGRSMFAQSDPESVTSTLLAAGFIDPQPEPVEVTLVIGTDIEEAVDYLAGTGPGRAAIEAVPADRRPAALHAVRAALANHTEPDGVHLGAAIWIITASTPG